MNRLRDEWGDDPVAIRGIEILRGTPPTPRMLEMKRRVWLAQQQREARRSGGLHLWKLRVGVVVGGAVLCVAGTSGAVIAAKRWIVPALREISHPAPKVAPRTAAAEPRARVEKSSPVRPAAAVNAESVPGAEPGVILGSSGQPGSVTAPMPTQALVQKASASSRSAAAPRAASARHAAASRGSSERPAAPVPATEACPASIALARTAPPTTAAAARERTQVLDAMIALRRDHDPVSAGAMLQHYLTSHPNGALREEALVLAIEAARARGDLALARGLAREYQGSYPNGRFRRYAEDQSAAGRL